MAKNTQYGTVTPWLISHDTVSLIKFIEDAFDGKETPGSRVLNADGSIGHVEVTIGDSIIMLFDANADWPKTPGYFRLFLDDAEKSYTQALKAGAQTVTKPTELFWGDMVSRVRDPLGNIWWIQTHVKDVSQDEIMERMQDKHMIGNMQYVQQSLSDAMTKA